MCSFPQEGSRQLSHQHSPPSPSRTGRCSAIAGTGARRYGRTPTAVGGAAVAASGMRTVSATSLHCLLMACRAAVVDGASWKCQESG